MYLLDTNICILAIKLKSARVVARLQEASHSGLFLSSITVAELEYGVQNSQQVDRNRMALFKFLSPFEVLGFTDQDAAAYGRMRAELKKRGSQFGPLDMLIAAQALSREMVLVTNNTHEFNQVDGLVLEDWK